MELANTRLDSNYIIQLRKTREYTLSFIIRLGSLSSYVETCISPINIYIYFPVKHLKFIFVFRSKVNDIHFVDFYSFMLFFHIVILVCNT